VFSPAVLHIQKNLRIGLLSHPLGEFAQRKVLTKEINMALSSTRSNEFHVDYRYGSSAVYPSRSHAHSQEESCLRSVKDKTYFDEAQKNHRLCLIENGVPPDNAQNVVDMCLLLWGARETADRSRSTPFPSTEDNKAPHLTTRETQLRMPLKSREKKAKKNSSKAIGRKRKRGTAYNSSSILQKIARTEGFSRSISTSSSSSSVKIAADTSSSEDTTTSSPQDHFPIYLPVEDRPCKATDPENDFAWNANDFSTRYFNLSPTSDEGHYDSDMDSDELKKLPELEEALPAEYTAASLRTLFEQRLSPRGELDFREMASPSPQMPSW
jgi:hypothetical protein